VPVVAPESARVVVAELVRPRGIRGEIFAISQTDVPGRLETLASAQARLSDGSDIAVEITSAWQHKQDWVLKLAGVDSIEAADRFRRAELWVPLAERGHLPDGGLFQTDLLGLALVDRATGNVLATVSGWQQFGGPPLLEAIIGGREVLIPFVPQICPTVDLERRVILVDLPDGLLEL
jgi:16S rRNA processing protein RimM